MKIQWHRWSNENELSASDAGRCFLLWIDWKDDGNESPSELSGYAIIGKWTGCNWMSQTDEDNSWSGPVKAVTHWARI